MTTYASPPRAVARDESAATAPVLTASGLRVSLRDGRRAVELLHGIDLDVHRGELLAIIGPNGSGKSTLLKALAGLLPARGAAGVRGTVRTPEGRTPRARDIALMPQHPELPAGMSVVEYVLLGRTPHLGALGRESQGDYAIVADVLRRLDLEAYAERPVSRLSGGEAQRVVLGRALAQEAPVLLLDEPTSSLDLGIQDGVLGLVDELRRRDGLTVVVAIHDLTAAARYADRLLMLNGGHVAALGTPAEVLRDDLLADIYGADLRVRHIDGELVVLPARGAPRRAL